MVLTSNRSLNSLDEVFSDHVIAAATLDRPRHHAVTLNIRGNSYRLQKELKANLVKPGEDLA